MMLINDPHAGRTKDSPVIGQFSDDEEKKLDGMTVSRKR